MKYVGLSSACAVIDDPCGRGVGAGYLHARISPRSIPPHTMMQSMTGFGRSSAAAGEVVVAVELRSLNAKQSDVRIKAPGIYREEELVLRGRLRETAGRGKVDLVVERKDAQGSDLDQEINEPLFRRYLAQLRPLVGAQGQADDVQLTGAILKLPNVVGAATGALTDAERAALHTAFEAALTDFLSFRKTEGEVLAADLLAHVEAIESRLPEVERYEAARSEHLRARLRRMLDEHLQDSAIDHARFEQEVLYYLEKIDIAEEKVRLAQHCKLFREKLADGELEKGRRLNFIGQEMGREINTLGAKAYSSDIQRLVVEMKDALEKIKEQVANVV